MTEDPFRHDDAAYVLGALEPADRARFEQHLRQCPDCADRVAELADLPATLARGGRREDVLAALESAGPPLPDTVLPALLAHAARDRRRRFTVLGALTGVAAALLAALLVAVWPASSSSPPARPVAMNALVATPLRATAALVARPWGTQIDLDCHYTSDWGSEYDYGLVVVDRHGARQQLGTWTVLEDRDTRYSSGTSLPRSQISAVEITLHGTPILRLATD